MTIYLPKDLGMKDGMGMILEISNTVLSEVGLASWSQPPAFLFFPTQGIKEIEILVKNALRGSFSFTERENGDLDITGRKIPEPIKPVTFFGKLHRIFIRR